MSISLAIVDDNILLLQTLASNLRGFSEVTVVFTATNGQQAIEMALHHKPAVILMDIDMPVLDGIQATAQLHSLMPDIKILMLTIFDRDDKLFDAIKVGASGYLLKDESPTRIVSSVEEVMNGGAPMSPGIASRALRMLSRQVFSTNSTTLQKPPPPESYFLTAREIEILELLSQGFPSSQIADRLFISDRTVRKHVENIYEKLHVHSRYEVIQLADKYQWFK
jgi:DNA-binding NarL/FixJ family response regulator